MIELLEISHRNYAKLAGRIVIPIHSLKCISPPVADLARNALLKEKFFSTASTPILNNYLPRADIRRPVVSHAFCRTASTRRSGKSHAQP
jgi:hypothetical protein